MRLTLQTDYALRLLMTLAMHRNRLVTIDEIASQFRISRNHLEKTAQHLAAAGYVETVRGRGGGLRLARAAGDIRVGDVIRSIEPDTALADCMAGRDDTDCALLPACRLKTLLGRGLEAFFGVMDGMTVEALVRGRPALLPER